MESIFYKSILLNEVVHNKLIFQKKQTFRIRSPILLDIIYLLFKINIEVVLNSDVI